MGELLPGRFGDHRLENGGPRFAPPVPAQFFLRAAFLAATGVLLIVWLAAA